MRSKAGLFWSKLKMTTLDGQPIFTHYITWWLVFPFPSLTQIWSVVLVCWGRFTQNKEQILTNPLSYLWWVWNSTVAVTSELLSATTLLLLLQQQGHLTLFNSTICVYMLFTCPSILVYGCGRKKGCVHACSKHVPIFWFPNLATM